jgi:hypothetical protein
MSEDENPLYEMFNISVCLSLYVSQLTKATDCGKCVTVFMCESGSSFLTVHCSLIVNLHKPATPLKWDVQRMVLRQNVASHNIYNNNNCVLYRAGPRPHIPFPPTSFCM